MDKIKINVLRAIPGYAEGESVIISVDENGVPKERFWRRRLSDSKNDNCIEIVSEVVSTTKKSEKTKSDNIGQKAGKD